MQEILYYGITLWIIFCSSNLIIQALPIIPQVWLDDQGQPFAIAIEGADYIGFMSNHALVDHWFNDDDDPSVGNDRDKDDMYTTDATILNPHYLPLRKKIMDYFNTKLNFLL